MPELSGRTMAVVGATSGIGDAMVRRFAEEGARVLLAGRRADRGTMIAGELRVAGAEAFFVEARPAPGRSRTACARTWGRSTRWC